MGEITPLRDFKDILLMESSTFYIFGVLFPISFGITMPPIIKELFMIDDESFFLLL